MASLMKCYAASQTYLPFPGDYVWYDSGSSEEFHVPIGAQVKTVTEDWLAVRTEDGEVSTELEIYPTHDTLTF